MYAYIIVVIIYELKDICVVLKINCKARKKKRELKLIGKIS